MAILGVFLVSLLVNMLDVQVHGYGGWTNAHATFYGGGDASGTMGHSATALQNQRRLISKSDLLGPLGVMQLRNHSPHVAAAKGGSGSGSGRNIMVGSPFATGVLVPDGVSIYYGAKSNLKYNDNAIYQPDGGYGLSDSACETSNPDARDDKRDGSKEEDEDEATLSRVVSPRDMATQMSPEGSTDSSQKGYKRKKPKSQLGRIFRKQKQKQLFTN